jgi:hypothetical protein
VNDTRTLLQRVNSIPGARARRPRCRPRCRPPPRPR